MAPSLKNRRKEFEVLWQQRKGLRQSDVVGYAKRAGWEHDQGGRHPATYVKKGRDVLIIPTHKGTTLKVGLACDLLGQLEEDLDLDEAAAKTEASEEQGKEDGNED